MDATVKAVTLMQRQAVLDNLDEDRFHDLTSLISSISESPIVIMNFANHDRIWFHTPAKKFVQTSHEESLFKKLTCFSDGTFRIISDLELNPHFYNHPFVAGDISIRFFASFPIETAAGPGSSKKLLGLVHIFDRKSKKMSLDQDQQIKMVLKITADQIEKEVDYVELRSRLIDSKQRSANLVEINRTLKAASAAKSDFLAHMSHEIRTPLNGVIGMTDLLMMSDLTSEQSEHLQVAHSAAVSLLSVINDILDFSKIEAGKLDVEKIDFDLDQLVNELHETVKLAARRRNLTLIKTFVGAPSLSSFVGDPGRIRQILLNLVNNAVKFTQNGKVQTSVYFEKISPLETLVRFEIKDNGAGIAPDTMAKLFNPFTQASAATARQHGGTGLGLSICKALVKLMHGKIGAESKLGQGSKFWFSLPLMNGKLNRVEKMKPAKRVKMLNQTTHDKVRILMAEDNSMNQKITLAMLAKLGYSADVVEHGKAAVEALRKQKYDLVLMDCQMPEMDGYQATQVIRKDDRIANDVTIIALTANAMKGDREKCLNAGMTDYLSKPMRVDALKEVLERHLMKASI